MDEPEEWRELFERFDIRVKREGRRFFNTDRVLQHQGGGGGGGGGVYRGCT